MTAAMTVWTRCATPLGPMVLAADAEGLVGAWFDGQKHFDGPEPDWGRDDAHPLLCETARQLEAWFAGRRTGFDLPLAPRGTPFQLAVWHEIARVGQGRTRSYGEVALAVGRPTAFRAVGAATGLNPISLIIPCHRLVGRNGALTGYAGGLDRKRALLAFEAGQPALWADATAGVAA
jgi:methylated-DNA-[protein]-cysteine S-methyltransferase